MPSSEIGCNWPVVGYDCKGLHFTIRKGTSDLKSIKEVIHKNGYRRTLPFFFDIEPQDFWLDLGANIGAFAVMVIAKKGAVLAVEPDPQSFELLSKNLKRQFDPATKPYDSRILNKAIVSDDRQITYLHQNIAHGNVWRNSIERSWRGEDKVLVNCMHIKTLLDYCLRHYQKPLCIKMDIEGTEMPILEWLIRNPEYIQKIKKLVFEWSFDVDPSLVRYRKVLTELGRHFILSPKRDYWPHKVWPASWFPPATKVFCLGK